jgi:hypothetical protein
MTDEYLVRRDFVRTEFERFSLERQLPDGQIEIAMLYSS